MTTLVYYALTVYIVTMIITSSSIFDGTRKKFMAATPSLKFGDYPHFIECRLCVGFWVALALGLVYGYEATLPAYGLAQAVAQMER